MKNKFYMIEILCKDTDNTIYNDNYRIGYRTFEKAEINQDDLWLAKVKEEENKISVEVRYCDEWQYDIILKEMEVE